MDQLKVIEDISPGITSSFRYFGIKMHFYGKKSKRQTLGFPSYAPQKCDLQILHPRWSVETFATILPTNKKGVLIQGQLPWKRVFTELSKVLCFHRASSLSSAVMAGLEHYVAFMEEDCQAWWDLLHWVTIDVDQDDDSQTLYDQRRTRTDSLTRRLRTEVKHLRNIKDFPETLFQEPGIWPLPQCVCNWIWADPRVVDAQGKANSLTQQLTELVEREPERTLWETVANETARTKHASTELRSHMIPLPARAKKNWIVVDRMDDEADNDDDEYDE